MTTIYTLTDEISRQKWAYTSLKAMFLHEANELYLDLSPQQYYRLLKKNGDKHPISIEGFTIEKGFAFNVEDAKKQIKKITKEQKKGGVKTSLFPASLSAKRSIAARKE